jgi:predicted RNA-binding protein YlxR (DUF448 family)
MIMHDKGVAGKRKFPPAWVLLLLFMFTLAGFGQTVLDEPVDEYDPNCGHLRGFIYKSDNQDPLWGAQLVLQDQVTLQVFRSNVTDSTGDYEVLNVPEGSYKVLIMARDNTYKVKYVDFLIRIVAGKTTTLSFSLKKSGAGFFLFLREECCEAAVIAGTALVTTLIEKFSRLGDELEQSPTQRITKEEEN